LRNAPTVPGDTSTACDVAAVAAVPATIIGFNSAMPANLPLVSSAAAPENPRLGAGDRAASSIAAGLRDLRFHA
jgi:hypothetical protein